MQKMKIVVKRTVVLLSICAAPWILFRAAEWGVVLALWACGALEKPTSVVVEPERIGPLFSQLTGRRIPVEAEELHAIYRSGGRDGPWMILAFRLPEVDIETTEDLVGPGAISREIDGEKVRQARERGSISSSLPGFPLELEDRIGTEVFNFYGSFQNGGRFLKGLRMEMLREAPKEGKCTVYIRVLPPSSLPRRPKGQRYTAEFKTQAGTLVREWE